MGFNNPDLPWSELERRLSGRRPSRPSRPSGSPRRPSGPTRRPDDPPEGADDRPEGADGSDSPAWSARRGPYLAPESLRAGGRTGQRIAATTTPYAELHCHSNFSFLDGASHPEELAEEATRLGLDALALTDHNGFYGVVRFAEAAKALGLPTVLGTELALDAPVGPPGAPPEPDPPGRHLVALARDPQGYAEIARAVSHAQLAGSKGSPALDLDTLAGFASDHWLVLTGCRKGTVPAALAASGPAAAARALDDLIEGFGRDNVAVELWDHGDPLDSARNDALATLAIRAGVEVVATNNVHYATTGRRRLATALAAVRARRSLDDMAGWLPAGAGAHLRSGAEQARRFARWPGVVDRAAELGRACAFDLALVAPSLPPFPCPGGLDEMTYLGHLVAAGAARDDRYGPRSAERVPGAWAQLDHELAVIDQLGYPGYFLIVADIVAFCAEADIYCQGRGSAANSAVCYALGITAADAVSLGLLFERFLSAARDGPPDIDLDIEAGRREEVIQYVYDRYGRHHAAQVANVITYRARSAIRDMGRALGAAPGQQDAWAKQVDRWARVAGSGDPGDGTGGAEDVPAPVRELAAEVEGFPRHLGIHSGGMVLCDRPVSEVCPVEWATMADRSVLQWDKDDCAAVGLVKFDLLGLGMLSALHRAIDLITEHRGIEVDLATIPQDPEVYAMLCRADSVGVFQVESRAQMATLPRLAPREFYDLVVEVALIRPGPIQGGSVHPYIRRRNGEEPVTYLHPRLERSLSRTLGVPLFQEQLMAMAIDVAGFSPAEADQLRQAMGAKRSRARMERLRGRLEEGMAANGITGEIATEIWDKLVAFSTYGFPESHSVSFAYLVYASSWIKRYEPAAFCAALLDAQPMGFYAPHTLVQDARRHGVEVRGPDVAASDARATLEPLEPLEPGDAAPEDFWRTFPPPQGGNVRQNAEVGPDNGPGRPPERWGAGGPTVRLGLDSVRGVGAELAQTIAAGQPYVDMEDLARRSGATLTTLEALATAGAFGCFGLERREALWAAGAVVQSGPERLGGIVTGAKAPTLPGMAPAEVSAADLWATGVSAEGHPTRFVRVDLDRIGVVTATGLATAPAGKVLVGGVVTHRQRPATAGGTMFVNLEDETGLINVVVSPGCWQRHRRVARTAPALLVRGRLERSEEVINVVAERLEPLPVPATAGSRDFR